MTKPQGGEPATPSRSEGVEVGYIKPDVPKIASLDPPKTEAARVVVD